jgi:hypothetical protein
LVLTPEAYGARMTVTEASPQTTRNGRTSPSDETPALSEQVVLSSAGLASQGINTFRQVADGVVSAVDVLVLGSLDIAEQVAASSLLADLGTKSIGVARQSWSTAVDTYRETIGAL